MKKILLIIAIIICTPLKANELKCEENYEHFKARIIEDYSMFSRDDLNSIIKLLNSNYYPINLKGPIPNKNIYWFGEWVNAKEYKTKIKEARNANLQAQIQLGDVSIAKPKFNYISDLGEICIIPVHVDFVMYGRNSTSTYDTILVRNLQDGNWKSYEYLGIEKRSDMEVLFPGLMDKVKLSQILVDDKDLFDASVEKVDVFLKSKKTNIPKEEFIKAVKKMLEPQNEMLKINGYK